MAGGKRWTEAELALLRTHYGKLSYKEIARLLGRTTSQVKSTAANHGVQRSRRWTAAEIEVLSKNRGQKGMDQPVGPGRKGGVRRRADLVSGRQQHVHLLHPDILAADRMTKGVLRISESLALPLDAVTQTFAILAKRGVGKTYTLLVMAEEMLAAGQQIVVVDPVGVCWGLRTSADGRGPGYPIVIVGGEHGDVPLESTGGRLVADLVVNDRVSLVIDLSLLRKAEQVRFMADFAAELYLRNRQPLHVFLDEADEFAPQKPGKDQLRMLGAIEDLVRRGRARGLGLTMATQRSAVLNKNVLTQIEVLIAMRTPAPQDQKAIDAWIQIHGTPEERAELMASLASLEIGTAWFWSPGWLQVFAKVMVRKRRTFDSSATPKAGAAKQPARKMADVDLAALTAKMAATIEAAAAADPKKLRAKIAELEKQLAKPPAPAKVEKSAPIVPLGVTKEIKLLQTALAQGDKLSESMAKLIGELAAVAAELRPTVAMLAARKILPAAAPVSSTAASSNANLRENPPVAAGQVLPPPRISAIPGEVGDLNPSETIVLKTIAQFPTGARRGRVAVFSGRSSKSSSFQKAFPALERRGLIYQSADFFVATDAGKALAGVGPLPSGPALAAHWMTKLTPSEAKVLRAIMHVYPNTITRPQVSAATGQSPSSSSFQKAFSALRDLQLISGKDSFLASDDLF